MATHNIRLPWVTFFIVLLLSSLISFIPIAHELQWFRPDWVLLLLLYWVMLSRGTVPLVLGFGVGLYQDILLGTLLGVHALAYTSVIFLAQHFYPRLKFYTEFQIFLMVTIFVGISELCQLWVYAWQFGFPAHLQVWGTTLMTLIAWPLLKLVTYQFRQTVS